MNADEVQPIVHGTIGNDLNAVIDKYAENGFSGYVLVNRGDKVLVSRGCGYRNREKQLPITGESLFETGSLAKPFTAIAVLLLQEDGKLDIHERLAKYIPEIPKAYWQVSIFHVLTHTAGMPRGGPGRGTDFKAALAANLSTGPEFQAGERVSYSNVGYSVLAGLVERVSGESLESFCHKRIFRPAGMKDTGFCGESFNDDRCALGYVDGGRGRVPYIDPYSPKEFGYEYRGMGGLITSAEDLLRFERAFSGTELLSSASKTLMTTVFRDSRSVGWEIFCFEEGIRCIAHGGSVSGYRCKLWIFPDYDSCLILLSNSESIDWTILSACYKAMFKDEIAVLVPVANARKLRGETVDAKSFKPVLGRFTSDFGINLEFVVNDGALFATLSPCAAKHESSSPAAEEAAASIIEGLASGETKPMRERLPARMKKWPKWPDEVLKGQWPAMAKGRGNFLSVETLGCVKNRIGHREDGERWHYVWLKLQFSEGKVISLMTFNDDCEMEMLILDAEADLFGRPGASTAARRISPEHYELSPEDSRKVDLRVKDELLTLQSGSLMLNWRR